MRLIRSGFKGHDRCGDHQGQARAFIRRQAGSSGGLSRSFFGDCRPCRR